MENGILPFVGLCAAMVSGDDPPFSIHESGDDLRAAEIDSQEEFVFRSTPADHAPSFLGSQRSQSGPR